MADRTMFVDALDQGLALVAPRIGDDERERIVDALVDLIGVWEPAPRTAANGRRPCHPDASYSGIDQTPVADPDKVWRCDSCGEVGTSAALDASHNGRRPSDGE